MRKIGIIGGGAAGFFAAITAKENNPAAEVIIIEKTSKLLSKVKISGGGRCNVTNATFENYQLVHNYPRGSKELKKAFSIFSTKDTVQWFESRGVSLKTEEDGRIFPASNDSQTIIDCLVYQCEKLGVKIIHNAPVRSIKKNKDELIEIKVDEKIFIFNKVLIAVGGSPKYDSYKWLEELGHTIVPPVPSLFTFNIPQSKYDGLQGISVNDVLLRISGTKASQRGPVLITHWGLSGPAVLRLSAWEARALNQADYDFSIQINWVPEKKEESLREELQGLKKDSPKKTISANSLFNIPRRLWERLVILADIQENLKWGDVPNKNLNKLTEELLKSTLSVQGKTTFKEEFVTCGGVSLKELNFDTMESIVFPGIYFAGEVIDIDAITGGFNFQAAWTTGYIAGKAMAS